MYAASVVEQRLFEATQELKFGLEYHSPEEVKTFNEELERGYADAYDTARSAAAGVTEPVRTFRVEMLKQLADPKKPRLSADHVRFIQNERALVMCDAAYFLTRYYYVLDEQNIRRLYKFRAGQRILFEVIAEMERQGLAIEIILAKARQLGMTTLVAGLILLKVMMSSGISGMVASADTGKTREMVNKILMAYDSLPWWLGPLTTRRVESEQGLVSFMGDSRLIFQHGKQTNPIAMGTTPITYHLSEVSAYQNPADLIEVGLFKCVHASPRVLGILESTCKGDTGWWHDTYWSAKNYWDSGGSRLMALFLPFYCDTDLYPNPTWLRKSPVPEIWSPNEDTRRMIAESEMYVKSNPLLDKVLREKQGAKGDWYLPKEQAWFWEQNFREHRRKGREGIWYQEMPHDDHVAFQGSYDSVFGNDTLNEIFKERSTCYNVYAIIGQSIEDRHDPNREDMDLEEPIVQVTYESIQGKRYDWELIPLKWVEPFRDLSSIQDDMSHMGKFFVWEPPQPGYDYSIGVDTSNGMGRDCTVIAVSRRGRTDQERDEQVAEFRSNVVGHVEAYAWVIAIAAYYGKYMVKDTTKSYREPYVSVEQIQSVGDTCQHQMQRMGYRRFHKMIRYDQVPKTKRKSRSTRQGWFTAGWSRPMLTDTFVVLVQNKWYKIHSPYTIREMTQWEVHYTTTNKEKFEHAENWTDDGIFANAMAAFCPNDMKTMADRSLKQFRGDTPNRMPELDFGSYGSIVIPAHLV